MLTVSTEQLSQSGTREDKEGRPHTRCNLKKVYFVETMNQSENMERGFYETSVMSVKHERVENEL